MTTDYAEHHSYDDDSYVPPAPEAQQASPVRPLRVIAREIWQTWERPYFGAFPYIEAMGQLESITDRYYLDPADDIVRYFLSNARTWRGPAAQRIKAELRALLHD